jgi:hypothetical protein
LALALGFIAILVLALGRLATPAVVVFMALGAVMPASAGRGFASLQLTQPPQLCDFCRGAVATTATGTAEGSSETDQ